MSAYWKIPLQALVLLVGVFIFLFYLFTPSPMLFNPVHERALREGLARLTTRPSRAVSPRPPARGGQPAWRWRRRIRTKIP